MLYLLSIAVGLFLALRAPRSTLGKYGKRLQKYGIYMAKALRKYGIFMASFYSCKTIKYSDF
jgi:hypothetical protein